MKDLKTLDIESGSYATTFTKKHENKKPWVAKNPKEILSFIPGTITSVDVKVGDRVKEGDTLLSFNAMKMSNQYKSPVEGVVGKVNVAVGDAVPKGSVLIEFE